MPDQSFMDFNFKLAVIQQLMYDKGLLSPPFDVYEFVDGYTSRVIDIDEEGYEIILKFGTSLHN